MRPLFAAVLGVALVGFGLIASALEFQAHHRDQAVVPCERFLDRPGEGWVRLAGCQLDFELALLAGQAGVFERLSHRRQGTWTHLPGADISWKQVLVPVKTALTHARPARAVLVLTEPDLLAWVNALEAEGPEEGAKRLRRVDVLRRLSAPSLIEARASRADDADQVRLALGPAAAPGLSLLHPGTRPPAQTPLLPFAAVLGGVWALVWAARGFNRAGHRRALTPAEEAALVDLSGVKVELGDLQRLREEEAEERRRPGRGPQS